MASAIVILIAACTLGGWLFDVSVLRGIFPGLPAMMPVTALSFILTGIALWLSRASADMARLGAWLIILIALLTLLEYLIGLDLGMDLGLFRGDLAISGVLDGCMVPPYGGELSFERRRITVA